LSSKINRYC